MAGSAFAQLTCAAELAPTLTAALGATRWRDRERHLAVAYETVASMHNALALTDPVDPLDSTDALCDCTLAGSLTQDTLPTT